MIADYYEQQGANAKEILRLVRKFKSEKKLPLNAVLEKVIYGGFYLDSSAEEDVRNAIRAKVLVRKESY